MFAFLTKLLLVVGSRLRMSRSWCSGRQSCDACPEGLRFVYNRVCTHLSLDKDASLFQRRQTVDNILSVSILGGLHHLASAPRRRLARLQHASSAKVVSHTEQRAEDVSIKRGRSKCR
jgi:hypothetical protein